MSASPQSVDPPGETQTADPSSGGGGGQATTADNTTSPSSPNVTSSPPPRSKAEGECRTHQTEQGASAKPKASRTVALSESANQGQTTPQSPAVTPSSHPNEADKSQTLQQEPANDAGAATPEIPPESSNVTVDPETESSKSSPQPVSLPDQEAPTDDGPAPAEVPPKPPPAAVPLPPTPKSVEKPKVVQQKLTNKETTAPGIVEKDLPYCHSSLMVGRLPDRAVILMMGTTGHGKSKTINRLLGWNLLQVAGATTGSETKVVQRAEVPLHDAQTDVTINLAFDDTPGNEDTTYVHRGNNAVLIHRYSEAYFSEAVTQQMISSFTPGDSPSKHGFRGKTYPNVILLVASWDTIKRDAHNEPSHFTSPIGRTMFSLKGSNLVDLQHTNVIVVVTKSLSFWSEYEDYGDDEDEKKKQWMADAEKKASIIGALQHKAFPTSSSWRIVFIENGAGKNPRGHKLLPNGELSHQNLFLAIRDLVSTKDKTKAQDLVGMHALRLLTGAESVRSHFPIHPTFKTLCRFTLSDTITVEERAILDFHTSIAPVPSAAPSSTSDQIRQVANNFLGFTYNPVYGSFGRACVLDLDQPDIQIKAANSQFEEIIHATDVKDYKKFTAAQLRVDFNMRDVAGLGFHYSSSSAFESAVSMDSQTYIATKLTAVAKVPTLVPRLSEEMLTQIKALPPWSATAAPDYANFFGCHGTHVVLCAALGGVLRIVSQGDLKVDTSVVKKALDGQVDAPILAHVGIDAGLGATRESGNSSMSAARKEHVTVFRDGGGAAASELSGALEQLFSHLQNPSSKSPILNWTNARVRWMEALESDSVFCPHNQLTQYWWLYNCEGLTPTQKTDLKLASEFYLGAPEQQPASTAAASPWHTSPVVDQSREPVTPKGDMPRAKNLKEVDKALEQAQKHWLSRFGGWMKFWNRRVI